MSGVTLHTKGDLDAAISAFEASIAIEPSADAFSNLSLLHVFRKPPDTARALELLRRAVEYAPNGAPFFRRSALADRGGSGASLQPCCRARGVRQTRRSAAVRFTRRPTLTLQRIHGREGDGRRACGDRHPQRGGQGLSADVDNSDLTQIVRRRVEQESSGSAPAVSAS